MTAHLGTLDVVSAYVGSTVVDKIYIGTTQVWPAGGGGTPTLTARTNGSNGTVVSDLTATSASFTPTANSKLYVFAWASNESNHSGRAWGCSGGSLSWTKIAEPALQDWTSAPDYDSNCAMFEADVGGSPASMTVTIDADTGGAVDTYYYSWAVFDVSGGTVSHQQAIQSVSEQESNGAGETLAVSLGTSATNGLLVVACFGTLNTSTPAMTTPSGWTALVNQAQIYTKVAVFYRTDFTSTTCTVSDLGDGVGVSGATIMELTL